MVSLFLLTSPLQIHSSFPQFLFLLLLVSCPFCSLGCTCVHSKHLSISIYSLRILIYYLASEFLFTLTSNAVPCTSSSNHICSLFFSLFIYIYTYFQAYFTILRLQGLKGLTLPLSLQRQIQRRVCWHFHSLSWSSLWFMILLGDKLNFACNCQIFL